MPLNFSHKHYVPILKTKEGERWALSNLSTQTKQNVTPLLEIHSHATQDAATHAGTICDALAITWGTDPEFFFDTIWLHGDNGNPAVIEAVYDAARENDLKAVPVVRLSYSESAIAQLRAVVEEDERGCMLRVRPDQLANPQQIAAALAELELQPQNVHFLLDYRGAQMNLAFDIPRIPNLNDWQTFTAASGAFPGSLAALQLNQWQQLARNDWSSWRNAVQNRLLRRPTYADYTTRDWGAPPAGGLPSVNLRYAREQYWLVRVGGRVRDGASPQMKQVCQSLIGMPEYSGQQYSAGDNEIFDTAQPGTGPGNAGQWVMWGINHHIVFTCDQIQNDGAL